MANLILFIVMFLVALYVYALLMRLSHTPPGVKGSRDTRWYKKLPHNRAQARQWRLERLMRSLDKDRRKDKKVLDKASKVIVERDLTQEEFNKMMGWSTSRVQEILKPLEVWKTKHVPHWGTWTKPEGEIGSYRVCYVCGNREQVVNDMGTVLVVIASPQAGPHI